jgi:hypothetical protein
MPGDPIQNNMFEFPIDGARPVWIASYPRSGNTFLRIILQNAFRLPSFSMYYVAGDQHRDPSAEALEEAPLLPKTWRERLTSDAAAPVVPIKTHGPPTDDSLAIFISRDGRAALDSYYHYHKRFAFEQPTLTEIIAGACQFGSWSDHYWSWHPKTRPNTLFLKYEELVGRPEEVISRIAQFLKLAPASTHLPGFDQLQRRSPEFFRRGQNKDYLNQWTGLEMALFNHLHAAAMKDLDFSLVASTEQPGGAVTELANIAARIHGKYLEQLSNAGRSFANHQADVARLSNDIQKLSRQVEQELKPLRKNLWVRLGVVIGAVRRKPKHADSVSQADTKAALGEVKPGSRRLKSSGENTRLSSPNLRTGQPSVPSEGISSPG